ncbi:DUF1488 domain-containing protein [Mesorhizobium sp. L-8-3]|uniref:DUF1488 domain-containing protein n=1 Tax=Mesorhizobium sp. L-8-3 TaxID=2744522 RepID=UPI00192934CA|nr:DUF1488 domain-containing protein [Mesorhizobium sp. L-8-3]BCH26448.1 hypothetical protein MesoLjLb_62330 [Mesorhizobium sp. L-8-3]
MTLTFPNRSRNFDQARKGVRFIAYDGMFEVPFLVDAAALDHESAPAEACLAAFDAGRGAIHDAAKRIYHGRQPAIYVIGPADLP